MHNRWLSEEEREYLNSPLLLETIAWTKEDLGF